MTSVTTTQEKMNAWASHISDKISSKRSQFRNDHKATCDIFDNVCGITIELMGYIWTSIVDLATSSFFPYLLVTFALNIPPFAYGLSSIFSVQCNSRWLFFNAFLTAMHMVTSVYTVHRIREGISINKRSESNETDDGVIVEGDSETPYVQAEGNNNNNINNKPRNSTIDGEPNSWERIRTVMCYDLVMAIYYILCLVWVIWQILGVLKIVNGQVDELCGRWVLLSVMCGFLYMGLGIVAWIFSLCFLRYNKLSSQHNNTTTTTNVENNNNPSAVLAVDDNGGIALA